MPTFVKQMEDGRVLIQVAAAVAADGSELDRRFMALVDTGATMTAVTTSSVDLGLRYGRASQSRAAASVRLRSAWWRKRTRALAVGLMAPAAISRLR